MKWKNVKEFPDLYEVSETGLVRSKQTGRTKTTKPDSEGYIRHSLSVDNKAYARYAHRLVAGAFMPNPNNYPIVHHKNNVRDDNRIKNLMWTTKKYNRSHAYITCPHCSGKVKV